MSVVLKSTVLDSQPSVGGWIKDAGRQYLALTNALAIGTRTLRRKNLSFKTVPTNAFSRTEKKKLSRTT